jgi:nitrite reductase/ring-hydroxylating ferredoxin subunit
MDENETGWTAVLASDELVDGHAVRVTVGEDEVVLLLRRGDVLFAIGDRCTHAEAPLHRGRIIPMGSTVTVTCPAHGSMFSLSDGRVMRGPATQPEPAYDVRVQGDQIEIKPRP